MEPTAALSEETVAEEHVEFIEQLSAMREENDEEKTFVPDVVIDEEEGIVTIGGVDAEGIVAVEDGETVLKVEALTALAESYDLNLPDTDAETITLEELAVANDMETTVNADGALVATDTYQTARIVVTSEEEIVDENAVSIAGPFEGTYILQYEDKAAAKEACESFQADDSVEFAEAEQLTFLAPIEVSDQEAYKELLGEDLYEEVMKPVETVEATDNISANGGSSNSATINNDSASTTQTSSFSYKNFDTWGYEVVGFSHMKSLVKKAYADSEAPIIKVAVIDTGIDYNHPWFKDRLVSKGYDFVNNDKNATDDYFHGTEVAGIIAKCTSKNVKILPLKAGDSNGSLSDIDVYNAIEYAIKKKVDVINMSFGRIDVNGSELMKKALNDAAKARIVLVGAYGNNGKKTSNYIPAKYSYVVGVSAVNVFKKRADFSNWGKYVDIAAPGECIYTAYPTYMSSDPYAYSSGTSLSAPYVAAAAAMIKTLYPNKSSKFVRTQLYKYAKNLGSSSYYGHGMLYLKKYPYTVKTTTEESQSTESTATNPSNTDSTSTNITPADEKTTDGTSEDGNTGEDVSGDGASGEGNTGEGNIGEGNPEEGNLEDGNTGEGS